MNLHDALLGLLGGVLIGAAAAALLVLNGRIAGISGILGGLFRADRSEIGWRSAFLAGLILGGLGLSLVYAPAFPDALPTPTPWLIVAGLLVGFGTRLGSGCTSGHGVCGIGRLSTRSLCATATFMAAAALTVVVYRHILGGW